MATYPSTYISRTSPAKPDAGIRVDIADDATPRYRKISAGAVIAMNLVHEWMPSADYAALVSFIELNGYGPHTLTLRGIDYSITLLNDPEVTDHRGDKMMVQVPAIGTVV